MEIESLHGNQNVNETTNQGVDSNLWMQRQMKNLKLYNQRQESPMILDLISMISEKDDFKKREVRSQNLDDIPEWNKKDDDELVASSLLCLMKDKSLRKITVRIYMIFFYVTF